MLTMTPRLILRFIVLICIVSAALSALWATMAGAGDATLTGSQITVTYTEPTTAANGQPLQDLRDTRVYLQLSGEGPGLAATVPASQVQGGGTISSVIVVPVGPMEETDVGVWATATDLAGNESERSEQKTVRIDRLPPAAPH